MSENKTQPGDPNPDLSDLGEYEEFASPTEDLGSSEPSSRRQLLSVPVKKPNAKVFFRIHETLQLAVDLYKHEPEGSISPEYYLVKGPMIPQFSARKVELIKAHLVVYVTPAGSVGFWPITTPAAGSGLGASRYYNSCLGAVALGRQNWIRLVWDKHGGAYTAVVAEGDDLGAPSWPEDHTLGDLMRLAFPPDFIVNNEEHPVLMYLSGKRAG